MGYQALAFVVALVVGMGLGVLGRTLLRSRVRLGWSEVLLAGIAGAAGGVVAAAVVRDLGVSLPVLAGLVAVGVTLLVLLAMERWHAARRVPRGTASELVRAGESAQVEFKSTARHNVHTGKRDEKIERVVAKTVAAFLNAEGGVLLVGVADDGTALGLDDDLALMKVPDHDRYELWLRDLLVTSLGATSAARVVVTFEQVDGRDVCVVRVPPSPRPVFLQGAKGEPVQLWVRIGNSTRELGVDEALAYCTDRWGRRALRAA